MQVENQTEYLAEITARLDYLKKTKGIGVIVGEPDSGKTSTLRAMADKLNPHYLKTLFYFLIYCEQPSLLL